MPGITGPGVTGGNSDTGTPLHPETATTAAKRNIDPRMLEMLVCPLTKTTLVYDAEHDELISRAARLAFPIRDGVPILLDEEARALGDDE